MIPQTVREWCLENDYGEIIRSTSVGGGCINHGTRLETSSGRNLFLKTNRSTPPDMFACEAHGLSALNFPDSVRVPDAFCWGTDFLLLEDLAPAHRQPDYWENFGRQLAALHQHTQAQFGFEQHNYIGSTPQPNPWYQSGYEFFAEQRLIYQAKLAHNKSLLPKYELLLTEKLAAKLPALIPEQPASLLHGDLWSGNAITDSTGAPAIIDPAVYYGWAEADLGMTALFGGFPDRFYQAYQEARPLTPGLWERLAIYNLYHLLNHLNLFGSGYAGQVTTILRKFAG
jgi:protein-ribulosamine 3-kinase